MTTGQKPLSRQPYSSVMRGGVSSHILNTYCVLGWPWGSPFVHVITFLSHSTSLMRQLLHPHLTEEEGKTQVSSVKAQAQAGPAHASVSWHSPPAFCTRSESLHTSLISPTQILLLLCFPFTCALPSAHLHPNSRTKEAAPIDRCADL